MHFLMSLPLNPFALARHVTCLGIMTMSPKFPMPSEYCSACGLSGRSWPCAGLRRVRWNAPNALEMRWNAPFAPNCAKCAELRRIAPIARCLRRLRWNCAGILPTAWHTAIYPWLAQPGCDLLTRSLQFPGSACRARFCGSLLHQFPHSCDFSSTVSHAEGQTMPVKN